MQQNHLFRKDIAISPDKIGDYLQQAIEIEIATIPTYLYTYYSINRSPNQEVVSGLIAKTLMAKQGLSLADANARAMELSAEIMVFANKAGALIMSIAIEEMLHLALSSNIKQAIAGQPLLTGKSPDSFPTSLPGHIPEFDINLAPLSLDQVMTMLRIESPKPLAPTGLLQAQPVPFYTIGEFYTMIMDLINNNTYNYASFRPQLAPGKGYYAPNNIDTVYYNKQHQPRFVDADNSGDLMLITDAASATAAIEVIMHQGEGNNAPGFLPDGSVDCTIYPEDYDDANFKELSHFAKFSVIYCQYRKFSNQFDDLDLDFGSFFVNNVPTNPKTSDYPANIRPVSDLINGIYTYIFIMIEGCYKQGGNTQYEIFMFGIHKSMIFILNSLCGDINGLTYEKDGKTYMASATFENYPFGGPSSPKSQLLALYQTAVAVYPKISYLGQRFQDLPDVRM